MAEGTQLGRAWVQIVPSAKGISGSIRNVLSGEASAAGKEAGHSIVDSIKGVIAAAGIGAAFKSVLTAGGNFDAAMSQVAAVSGATGTALDDLREKAKALGASTKFSATESAEAFNYMAMAGWKTEDMLSGIDGILSLAAASGEDLATTSDIVTDALTAFGLGAEDASHFSDVLAAASSNANTNVSMMGETFKYVAPVVGALYGQGEQAAQGMEDAALAVGLMANAGIKSTQAGTSLKSILTRLSTDAGATSKSLGALGTLQEKLHVEFYETDGTVRNLSDVLVEARAAWAGLSAEEQTSYAKTIAGQEAMSGWLAMMNAAPEDVEKLTAAIQNADGAAADMAAIMQDNLPGAVTIFKSAVEGLQIAAFEKISEPLKNIVQTASDWVSSITTAIDAEGFAAGLSAAIDGAFSMAVQGLNIVAQNAETIAAQGLELVETLALSIIGGIPYLAEAALNLAASFGNALLTMDWLSVGQSFLASLRDSLDIAAVEIFGAEDATGIPAAILTSIGGIVTQLPGKVVEIVSGLAAAFTGADWSEVSNGVRESVTSALDQLSDAFLNLLPEDVRAAVADAFERIAGAVDTVRDAAEPLIPILTGIAGGLSAFVIALEINTALGSLSGLLSAGATAFEGFGIMAQGAFNILAGNPILAVIAVVGALAASVITLWNTNEDFRNAVGPIWDAIKEKFSQAWQKIQNVWSRAQPYFSDIWAHIQKTFSVAVTVLGGFFTRAWQVIQFVWSQAAPFFALAWRQIERTFSVVEAVLGGAFRTAWAVIKTVWDAAIGFFENYK